MSSKLMGFGRKTVVFSFWPRQTVEKSVKFGLTFSA